MGGYGDIFFLSFVLWEKGVGFDVRVLEGRLENVMALCVFFPPKKDIKKMVLEWVRLGMRVIMFDQRDGSSVSSWEWREN